MAWHGTLSPDDFLSRLDKAIAYVAAHPYIVGAAWWSDENTGYWHYLENADGTLLQRASYSRTAWSRQRSAACSTSQRTRLQLERERQRR
jgi:hypothetical protein